MIELDALSHPAVRPLSLSVARGESLAICGPSGAGKTTLLRLIAGLERPSGGQLRLFGQSAQKLPPHRRRVAMVFQGLALWPHLSVGENLRLGGVEELEPLCTRLGIAEFLSRSPDRLSGGERQRVALARALGTRAEILLLDEPLSQLDTALRARVGDVLAEERAGRTMLYVTHSAREALRVADRILFLEGGSLLQLGPPAELLHRPAGLAVASFFGPVSRLSGLRTGGVVTTCLGSLELPGPDGPVRLAGRVAVSPGGTPARLVEARELELGWELHLEVEGTKLTLQSAEAAGPDLRVGWVGPVWELAADGKGPP